VIAMLRWSAFVVAMATSATATGEPTREVVELRYEAPAACPQRDAFAIAVLDRAPGASLVTDPAPARRVFAISIAGDATGTGYLGTLAVTGSATRSLSAPSCDEVVSALALIAALAIDPEATAPPPPTPQPAVSIGDTPPRPPPPPAPGRDGWQIVAIGGATVDVTPGAMPIAGVEGRRSRRGLGHVGAGVLAGRDAEQLDVGTARFTWVVGRLSACWVWRQAASGAIESDLCGYAIGGTLAARGEDIVGAQGATRAWFAAGADIGVRWSPIARTFVELRGGVTIPLVRDLFYFNPDVMVHRAGPVTPWMVVGAGVRFE
jgi:hypothetical protein